MQRFLLHVLPTGFHKIRHYGLCASYHVASGTLTKLRELLGPATHCANAEPGATVGQAAERAAPETWLERMLALTGRDLSCCPRCQHGRMQLTVHPLVLSPAREDSS